MQNITPKNDDERFMLAALDEARAAAERDEVPIGAVVVCQGRIIARAHNLTETLTDVTAHAEMQAITSAAAYLGGKYLTDCTLYVTVEPCLMCAGALGWSQIARVVYGAADDKRGYHTFCAAPFHKKTQITAGVLEAECSQLMTDFFRRKR
ncbi:MAG: nucleoside deaminase [Bacteroidales bacterium]|nr:nucleoside deaminase [Bacteroidales bacterium]MEE0908580.1 nucleoside deaminase [Muribaculaceae bacterium]